MTRSFWSLLFALNVTLAVLLALSVPFLEPGTPSFVLALLSAGLIGASLLGLGVVLYVGWDPFSGG